ncbi:MAG: hypothetical protein WBD67_03545, partial [Terracidiphilus sp.]
MAGEVVGRRLALGLMFVLAWTVAAPARCAGQAEQAAKPSASQSTNQAASQAHHQNQAGATEAYTLPPEKLAKAIALSRIRNLLAFAGELWGLVVLWLLLATRAAAWLG